MANLKRNKIELLKNVEEVEKGGNPEFETFWTPPFIPWRKIREALQLQMEIENGDANELELMDKMADFVATDIYGGRFTKDDLYDRLHCPDGTEELMRQVQFLANGEAAGTSKNLSPAKKS